MKVGTNLEWERYRFKLPKSGAEVEIIGEIVMGDEDMDYMDITKAK